MSLIEKPYEGRSTAEETMLGGFKITIPAPRKWYILIFLGFWLCGWLFGEVFALTAIISSIVKSGVPMLFLVFWVTFWTVGGIFALSIFIWNLTGVEIITIGQGELSITKKGALFFKPKTYDLNVAQNFRVQEEFSGYGRTRNFSDMYGIGTIRFDYGMKTIKFGAGIEEAEAIDILRKLSARKIIKYTV